MKGSLRIARVAGVPISLHWSFSLLLVYVALASYGSTWSAAFLLLLWVAALFACVTLHELSHCAVAVRRGLSVQGIVLLPIGGISEISGEPASPGVEAAVAIAGPLSSLALAGLFALGAVATGASVWPPTLFAGPWLVRLAWLNLLLAAFNMIPALPMDGGRVLRAVLARRGDPEAATVVAAAVAQVVAAGMVLVGLWIDIWLVLIGVFVFVLAGAERRFARLRRAFQGLRVADVMARDPTAVPSHVTVAEVGRWLASYPGRAVPVEEVGSVVGIVSMPDLIGKPASAAVGTVCDRAAPICEPSMPLFPDAVQLLAGARRDEFAVADGGRPVGVLYRMTVEAFAKRSGATATRSPAGSPAIAPGLGARASGDTSPMR
jgi:Zn-dependent protease